jgi:hypothetical protein
MAITRAQQYRQMLEDGGMLVQPGFGGTRQGYKGGQDAASDDFGGGSGNTGGDGGGGREDRISEQYGQSRTTAQKGTLSDPVEKQDFFTQSYTGPEVLGGLFGGYRDTVVPNTTAYGNRSRLGSLVMSGIGTLAGVPGLGFLTNVGPFNNKAFFDTKVVPSLLDKGKIPPSFKEYMDARRDGKIDAYGNPINQDDDNNIILPVDTTFAQAPSTEEQEPEVEDPFQLSRRFRAEGGIMNADVVGGEFDFESARQMYGLGKLVKKVTKTVKKIAKSDLGKAAILAAGGYYLGGGAIGPFQRAGMSGFKFANLPGAGFFAKSTPVKLAAGVPDRLAFNAARTAAGSSSGSLLNLIGGKVGAGILGASAIAGLLTPEQEEEAQDLARGEGIDIDAARNAILAARQDDFRARRFRAEGGSMKEPVAKKTMPLLDLDGKEMDLRAEGGFVPIGRMEKADDVPARLSKNEFVFTADAVRNAGDGNVDKGAEVMYNMMKNLEAGGEVSKESQGLEGARRMFQTSKRLEEVL